MRLLDRDLAHRATLGVMIGDSPALAGYGSAAWKINSEIVLLLGWGRAILMQLAHPLVAQGVADHSRFLHDPKGRRKRLRQTLRVMLALTFGTPADVGWAAGRINAMHDIVNGHLVDGTAAFPAGTPYSAHDPDLLRWVHATLLDTFLRVYELYVGPLTPAEKDGYCREATGMGPLLGLDRLPASVAELDAYLADALAGGEIEVTPTARHLAHAIVWPPTPAPARPVLWLPRLTTIGLLPPTLREAYGFPWPPAWEARLHRSAAAFRRVMPHLPPLVRHWPAARSAARRSRCTASPSPRVV